MKRRILLAGLTLSGCGLSERPYAERRQWPLLVRRPRVLPPARQGRVLLVRALRAGPGMEARGLQSLQPDGSLRTEFYEEWAVPPNEAVEAALRQWLADCGQFTAVIGPGSRLPADIVLEGELTALWSAAGAGHASLGIAVIEQPTATPRIRLQQSFAADIPQAGPTPAAAVQAMTAAMAELFMRIERSILA